MFDVGFWELAIIALVALIVIGPERLPAVARTVGKWLGRTRRFVNQVKGDIEREIRQDEIRKALENESGFNEIKQALDDTQYSFEEEGSEPVNTIEPKTIEPGTIKPDDKKPQADSSNQHPLDHSADPAADERK